MPIENDKQGIASLSTDSFIQGWQTYVDSSSDHYATLLGSNETDVLIDAPDSIHWDMHLGGFTFNENNQDYLFYPAVSTTAPSQTFSLVTTEFCPSTRIINMEFHLPRQSRFGKMASFEILIKLRFWLALHPAQTAKFIMLQGFLMST